MKGNDVQTEVLIRFNNNPNHKDFDLAFYRNKFTIDENNQGKLTKDYSIRFMIICLNDSHAKLKAKFLGLRPNRQNKGQRKFEKIQYHDFLNFDLDISKKKKLQIEMMNKKVLPKVKKNKKMAYICNENYRKLKSRKRLKEFFKQKEIVIKRKERIFMEKKIETEKRLDKFLKIKLRVKTN